MYKIIVILSLWSFCLLVNASGVILGEDTDSAVNSRENAATMPLDQAKQSELKKFDQEFLRLQYEQLQITRKQLELAQKNIKLAKATCGKIQEQLAILESGGRFVSVADGIESYLTNDEIKQRKRILNLLLEKRCI
ncbi:MAG: hypothetical protein OEZ58_09265 [Gammaproteobacteria bacterium]|nr:hypothetical protein [Gammaproteobacteria bacterium]MDH5729166.1 hypothetical protein [Gammaproteobacteria bacterium]